MYTKVVFSGHLGGGRRMTGRASEISEADERSEGSFLNIQIPHLLKFFFAAKYLFLREGSPRGGEGFGCNRGGGGRRMTGRARKLSAAERSRREFLGIYLSP